jgi:hypothetical protein
MVTKCKETVVARTKVKYYGAEIQTICNLNNNKVKLMKFVRNCKCAAAASNLEKYDGFIPRGGCCPSLV